MHLATDTAIDALAVMRLSRLVRHDTILDGPRYALTIHRHTRRWFPQFVKCPWCVSTWCGFVVALGRRFLPEWWGPLALALASSYVASIAAERVEAQASREQRPVAE